MRRALPLAIAVSVVIVVLSRLTPASATTIPEPAALFMLGTGLALVGFRLRKRTPRSRA